MQYVSDIHTLTAFNRLYITPHPRSVDHSLLSRASLILRSKNRYSVLSQSQSTVNRDGPQIQIEGAPLGTRGLLPLNIKFLLEPREFCRAWCFCFPWTDDKKLLKRKGEKKTQAVCFLGTITAVIIINLILDNSMI